jgi:hypothetical protein
VKFPLTFIPLFDLADVDLKDFPDCDQHLKPLRDKCENHYIKAIDETKFRHRIDFNIESFRRAVFCDVWRLKTCVAKATEGIKECGPEAAKRYQIMSNDWVIDEVLGKCSEYMENSSIRNFAVKVANNLFFATIISFIIIFLFF